MNDVVLADGRDAVVRPLAATDRQSLEELFGQTSAENLYTRFFSIGAGTVQKYLDHLFSGDPSAVIHLLTCGDRLLGIADVELLGHGTAEIAFLVADDSHGCGVATLLLERAAADARGAGITWFVADILTINHSMLQVFADAGFPVTTHSEGISIHLRMSTAMSPAVMRATARRRAAAPEADAS